MSVDNDIYNRVAHGWWDDHTMLALLREAINPARFAYFCRVVLPNCNFSSRGVRVLDLGCGGGLLAEEFARLGYHVTGLDPSQASLCVAQKHAVSQELLIDYCVGVGESLPFTNATYDIVACCDTLEHVADWQLVVRELARVLKPGGIFLYNTPNRTFLSKLVLIKLLQEWRWTRLLAPGVHDWHKFIRPQELHTHMAAQRISQRDIAGFGVQHNLCRAVWLWSKLKRGNISYGAAGRNLTVIASPQLAVEYIGYGVKQ